MKKIFIQVLALSFVLQLTAQPSEPVRLGIAGLSHSHVQPLLRDLDSSWFKITGIYEPNIEMAQRYAQSYGFDPSIIYTSLEEMPDKTKPEGVLTFTSIYDHLKVVEVCAPRSIHVMVEKPFSYFSAAIRGMVSVTEEDLGSLSLNRIVVEILEAAVKSKKPASRSD